MGVIIRILLWCFSISGVLNAIWMLAAPLHWYHNLPAHIPHYGAFNEHFVRDVGVAFLTAAIGLGVAAIHPRKYWTFVLLPTLFLSGHAAVHLVDAVTGGAAAHLWRGEVLLVYVPSLVLISIAVLLYKQRA